MTILAVDSRSARRTSRVHAGEATDSASSRWGVVRLLVVALIIAGMGMICLSAVLYASVKTSDGQRQRIDGLVQRTDEQQHVIDEHQLQIDRLQVQLDQLQRSR